MSKPILLLDFDGVIHSYKSGWQGVRNIPDMPVSGALEFIVNAMNHFQVCVYSARSGQLGGKWAMKKWFYRRYAEIGGVSKTGYPAPFRQLNLNTEIPKIPKWFYDYILSDTSMEPWEWEVHYGVKSILKKIKFPTKKPGAFLTIDDRAICFDGEFQDPEELLNFKPWHKGKV